MFHAAVARAGLQALEPLVPHDLRHSFGTEAYRLTGDIKAVGAALGQKTLRITERYVLAAVSTRVESLITQLSASLPPVTLGETQARQAPGRVNERRGILRIHTAEVNCFLAL